MTLKELSANFFTCLKNSAKLFYYSFKFLFIDAKALISNKVASFKELPKKNIFTGVYRCQFNFNTLLDHHMKALKNDIKSKKKAKKKAKKVSKK